MRVLQVCPYDVVRPGGVQRHVLDLSMALASAGHEVTVVAPPAAGAARAPGCAAETPSAQFRLCRVGRSREWRMDGTAFELTLVRGGELDELIADAVGDSYDVAHFHNPWSPFMPWQVFRRVESLVARRVATFHETPAPGVSGCLAHLFYRVSSRRLSRRLSAMISVSESSAGYLRPHARCPLVRLPPCIDLRPYFAVRRSAGGRPGAVVLFVGRLEPRKGVLLLVEAFARVRARHPTAKLVVCGGGEQLAAAQRLAFEKGIGAALRFTGPLGDGRKLDLYAAADVFCAPSPYGESYGLVIAEAMAAGLPVVAAANAGYRATLAGEGAAGLVPPGDVEALAARLSEMLANVELREKLSSWGRAEARRSDVRLRLAEFLAIYAAS